MEIHVHHIQYYGASKILLSPKLNTVLLMNIHDVKLIIIIRGSPGKCYLKKLSQRRIGGKRYKIDSIIFKLKSITTFGFHSKSFLLKMSKTSLTKNYP